MEIENQPDVYEMTFIRNVKRPLVEGVKGSVEKLRFRQIGIDSAVSDINIPQMLPCNISQPVDC